MSTEVSETGLDELLKKIYLIISSMSEKVYTYKSGHPCLEKIEEEVIIRHQYKRGEQAGESIKAKIQDGHIIYNGQEFSLLGAAHQANSDVRHKEYRINGWT